MGYTSVRKCIHIEIDRRYNLIREKEWTGETVSVICKRYSISRKSYYKWKKRYKQKGIEGLLDLSKRPHNIRLTTIRLTSSTIELRINFKMNGMNQMIIG